MGLISNLSKPNKKKTRQAINSLKILLGGLAVSSYATAHSGLAFGLLIGGGVVDIILSAIDPGDNGTSKTDV